MRDEGSGAAKQLRRPQVSVKHNILALWRRLVTRLISGKAATPAEEMHTTLQS